MNLQESIRAASDQIRQAVLCEEQGKLEHALEYYRRGVARFRLICANNKKNKELCKMLDERIVGYEETVQKLAERVAQCEVAGGINQCEVHHNGAAEEGAQPGRYAPMATPSQVQWEDIVGLSETKRLLRESVILPRELPQLYTGIRKAPRAILLYGPPGNGKTELVRALASEMACMRGARPVTFYTFTSADIISKFVGESARNMRELFEEIRAHKPCILFIDEIDSICSRRGDTQDGGGAKQALNEFLIQLDGMCKESMEDVLLLGATNLPHLLDGAMLRRMAARVYVPMPDLEVRRALFARLISQNDNALLETHYDELAQATEGYSASDITNVCSDAAMLPVRRLQDACAFHRVLIGSVEHWMPCGAHCKDVAQHDVRETMYDLFDDKRVLLAPPILFTDLLDSLARNKPSVSPEDLIEIDKFTQARGQKF